MCRSYIIYILPLLLNCFGDVVPSVRTATEDAAHMIMGQLTASGACVARQCMAQHEAWWVSSQRRMRAQHGSARHSMRLGGAAHSLGCVHGTACGPSVRLFVFYSVPLMGFLIRQLIP